MEAKLDLASTTVSRYHGAAAAEQARTEFRQRFREREFPVDSAERKVLPPDANTLIGMMVGAGLAPSKTEARRLVAQGGVELDGEKMMDGDAVVTVDPGREYHLKVGKKRFAIVRFGR